MPTTSLLERAVAQGLKTGQLWRTLAPFMDEDIREPKDVRVVCNALRHVTAGGVRGLGSAWHSLVSILQQVRTREAADIVRADAAPMLVAQVREDLSKPVENDVAMDVFMALKVLAIHSVPESVDLIVLAANFPLEPQSMMWGIIFATFAAGHRDAPQLVKRLSHPLPGRFIAIALLDLANAMLRKGNLDVHPFDQPQGHALLENWLRSEQVKEYSYAASAAAALPYLSKSVRDRLLPVALAHADARVQMRAARVAAELGNDDGFRLLEHFAEDDNHRAAAVRHLEELRHSPPPAAQTAEARARGEMVQWLAAPQEFGRPPDSLELYDTRELFWPPTNDRRRLWLFHYIYESHSEKGDVVGMGMVGSMTHSLHGEVTADLTPDEAYALHCCWELQTSKDFRAPLERSVEAGRRIIDSYAEMADEPPPPPPLVDFGDADVSLA
jgi:hypothetical protein